MNYAFNIFVETDNFFQDSFMNSKFRWTAFIYFTVVYDQFNLILLNKSNYFFQKNLSDPKLLNDTLQTTQRALLLCNCALLHYFLQN